MEARVESFHDETKRLQRGINDLTSLLALPAIWSGGDPSHVIQTLIDALLGMLRLDFIFVRFRGSSGGEPIEMMRAGAQYAKTVPEHVGLELQQWFDLDLSQWPGSIRDLSGQGHIAILPFKLGLNGDQGLLVAGASRAGFPETIERLLLSVAANQAAIGLEAARRLRGVEQALSASERDLRLIVDTIPAQAWTASPDGSGEFFNQYYIDYVGLSLHQLQKLGWETIVHPDDLSGLWEAWRATVASCKAGESEARLRRADGEYRWFLFRWNPVHDSNGKIIKWYGINADIEDRKRAEIHLAGERQILEMIASGRPLREILDSLCRLFEKSAPDCYCGIYPIDEDGRAFQYGVAPSLPLSYTAPIEGMLVTSDVSPRGQCITELVTVVAEDIASDVRWIAAPCRAHVLEHGLRAVWSTPVCSRGGVAIGSICVYQEKPGAPSPTGARPPP